METIIAVAMALGKLFGLVSDIIPTDKIREERFFINKRRLEQNKFIETYDKQFHRLKHHWEIDIATDTNAVCFSMDDGQREMLIKMLIQRIEKFRYSHPFIFRKWIALQKENAILASTKK